MHFQKITHKSYRFTVVIAVVLCAMIITIVSILGRGAMQLQGALVANKPVALTFAVLAYEKGVDLDQHTIAILPQRYGVEYAAYGKTKTEDTWYLVTVIPENNDRHWILKNDPEKLHEGFVPPKNTSSSATNR